MFTLRRIGILLAFAAALSLSVPDRELGVVVTSAEAKKKKRVRKTKVCKRYKGKRRCRWIARFSGHNQGPSKLRAEAPPKPSGKLHIYARNGREELEINIYDDNGEFDDAALAALDKLFRCRRSGKIRAGDPRLYQTLSSIYDEFGARIDLTSGFRYRERASSRHNHGAAADISIPGVSARKLYKFTSGLDAGGMGIGLYPRSGFIHVDWRAPGAKSYRWTDYSPPGSSRKKRKKSRKKRKRKPNA
jgi:uncharacterized protein YcbK (DUF882 family)